MSPNKIISKTFYCMECKKGPFGVDEILQHGCLPPFNVMESVITCTKKPIWHFIERAVPRDIGYWLAFMGLIIVNGILVGHVGLSLKECIPEAIAFGFAIPRLLK